MSIISNFKKQKWIWLTALVLIIGIKLWAQNHYHVEYYYTKDFYYYFAIVLRSLFGWIPFSFGDILYFACGGWLLFKLIKNIRLYFKKKFTRELFIKKLWKLILLFATAYIVFN